MEVRDCVRWLLNACCVVGCCDHSSGVVRGLDLVVQHYDFGAQVRLYEIHLVDCCLVVVGQL